MISSVGVALTTYAWIIQLSPSKPSTFSWALASLPKVLLIYICIATSNLFEICLEESQNGSWLPYLYIRMGTTIISGLERYSVYSRGATIRGMCMHTFLSTQGEPSGWSFCFDSIVRGHHVYKTVWTPFLGEIVEVGEVVGPRSAQAIADGVAALLLILLRGVVNNHQLKCGVKCSLLLYHGSGHSQSFASPVVTVPLAIIWMLFIWEQLLYILLRSLLRVTSIQGRPLNRLRLLFEQIR